MSTQTIHKSETITKLLPMWHVILLDDDMHSYEYVITMLTTLFNHSEETAFVMAQEVDATGRVIVLTCHKEKAELKQDLIHNFGTDPLIPKCEGSMTAILELA